MTAHRIRESINGRAYEIEVLAIQPNRWRACLVRVTGGPVALMPFYGESPAEAADQLVGWLTRVHDVANGSARSRS